MRTVVRVKLSREKYTRLATSYEGKGPPICSPGGAGCGGVCGSDGGGGGPLPVCCGVSTRPAASRPNHASIAASAALATVATSSADDGPLLPPPLSSPLPPPLSPPLSPSLSPPPPPPRPPHDDDEEGAGTCCVDSTDCHPAADAAADGLWPSRRPPLVAPLVSLRAWARPLGRFWAWV